MPEELNLKLLPCPNPWCVSHNCGNYPPKIVRVSPLNYRPKCGRCGIACPKCKPAEPVREWRVVWGKETPAQLWSYYALVETEDEAEIFISCTPNLDNPRKQQRIPSVDARPWQDADTSAETRGNDVLG